MCIIAGGDQTIYNVRYANAKPRYGAGRDNDWQYSIEGVLGHTAFCKWHKSYYDINMGNYSVADVDNFYEVRTHPHEYLIIHPTDRDNKPFISVRGRNGEYKLDGWIYGIDGKKEEYWCDKFNKNRPAFFIPVNTLNDMNTLPGTLSFAFLETFGIPIEIGASFEIATHTIRITAIDNESQIIGYIAVEKELP